ncbi:MAG: hypothetical protein V3R86_00070 [Candidatus Hydrothermarchaeaceae archaeon]
MNITIRDVDERVFRKFKAEAVIEGARLGSAVTNAMKFWIDKKKKEKRPEKSLLNLKPIDWGLNTEKSSVEIDEMLYGD